MTCGTPRRDDQCSLGWRWPGPSVARSQGAVVARGVLGAGTVTELSDQELLEIARRAYVLLSDPGRWSGRHYAENAEGQWTPVGSERAQRFNLEGALVHAARRNVRSALPAILEVFRAIEPEAQARMKATSTTPLTHSEALLLLESAIAHLSFRPVRKQSGTHLRAVLPEDILPPNKKTGER